MTWNAQKQRLAKRSLALFEIRKKELEKEAKKEKENAEQSF